jgi:hypothetical protein
MIKKSNLKLSACILLCTLFCILPVSGQVEVLTVKEKTYTATLKYNRSFYPGDPIAVRLTLQAKRKVKKFAGNSESVVYYTSPEKKEKKIRKAKMYFVPSKNNIDDLFVLLPSSSWLESGEYLLNVDFTAFCNEPKSFCVKINCLPKDFVTETIPLGPRNTKIKTDTSPERNDQIKRLNKILETTNSDSIYAFEAYTPPTPATRRTSFFADRRTFTYSTGGSTTNLHYGIDYGIKTGNEVRACGRGKVVMAEDRISTGWSICIEHLPGLYSLYYHMSELKVKPGDMVEEQQLIGLSGATGLATGPHLHWEMRLYMEAVNPDYFVTDFTLP